MKLGNPFPQIAHDFATMGVSGLARTIVQALLIGGATGVVIGLFRHLNNIITHWIVRSVSEHGLSDSLVGCAVFFGLLLLAVISVLLLRIEPLISGSGIPQVELMVKGRMRMNWFRVLVCKFAGALTALTGGLSVGREGPCIMMGASLGVGVGRLWHDPKAAHEPRFLVGGSAAGLGAAFGAPMAGMCFAFEEMKTPLRVPMVITCAITAFAAMYVMQAIYGFGLVFPFGSRPTLPWQAWWLVPVVGVAMGALGVLYNTMLIRLTLWADKTKMLPMHLRVVIPFMCAGLFLYFYPTVLAGFGITTLQLADMTLPLTALLLLLTVKMLFSCASFATGVAGGLLMPILFMGAMAGACVTSALLLFDVVTPEKSVIILILCMAGLFGSSVRAPLTGAFLMLEMTGAYPNMLFIIITAYIAAYVADKMGCDPVYDSLRRRCVIEGKIKRPRYKPRRPQRSASAAPGGVV
ncbi:MAG: chloride channel protein [Desulfovibrio sp.]|uniref:chloride channel protein n=1 Tax=Desulfovibrio sp. TaxID=885 RepID=UPI0039E4C44D